MKKTIFNSVSEPAIVAIMALNAHVVFSDQAPNFLKWDVIGSILADGDSGSGSGETFYGWDYDQTRCACDDDEEGEKSGFKATCEEDGNGTECSNEGDTGCFKSNSDGTYSSC